LGIGEPVQRVSEGFHHAQLCGEAIPSQLEMYPSIDAQHHLEGQIQFVADLEEAV